ncbi:cation diffusion facilitator family transporter [Paenibacillus piri]|uniref:Cation transporter n=1 Tax=Paenibacillus piri TaxID=2547395 RepID=A0A4R5KKU2_9BACL|nr:cation diffusion facilitator family transporter [Paenibacillus piri]TDF95782.1 cation transporter [Paenibacillus piri]
MHLHHSIERSHERLDGHRHDHEHQQHDHHHGHGHHHLPLSEGNRKGLTIALLITASIMLLEFFGGIATGSLALLSDSGHMLSDAASLALSLVAVWFAAKPASPSKTFGYFRFEILAALFNGVTLFIVAAVIMWEAYHRFLQPPAVASGSMIIIAIVGLLANLLSAWSLMRKGDIRNNMNIRSAYLHVIGDALGSVGAIAAGLLMLAFGWYIADPIISVIVSLLILKSAWSLVSHTIHVLMEGTPAALNRDDVRMELEQITGVIEVHDLHIWTITSSMDSLSCHLLVEDHQDSQGILQQAIQRLEDRFQIHHATIQIEKSAIQHQPLKV